MCRTARFLPRRRTRCLDSNSRSSGHVDERQRRSSRPLRLRPGRGGLVKAGTAILLAFILLATAILVVASQSMPDPLAKFRTPDGRLTIPGRALTSELQRLLFHSNDLQPYTNVTFLLPARSTYPTERLVAMSFASPTLNVFVHQRQAPETWGSAIDHVLRVWFPPVDWHEVGIGIRDSVRDGVGWFFDLFTMNAKADTLSVDSTTVSVVDPAAATCTTSQSAAAGDNAVLVMLSNRGPTAYTTVTYGSVSLGLIAGTATSGTGFVRTEMWFYQGAIPSGAQTMTATLVSGTAKQVCATVLLSGVWAPTPTAGGTSASGTTANPSISISPASAGELAFAVMGIRGTTAPTAATHTGTTTLAAATTIASIDMTNFTGTLDTTASNWGLTVNGPFAIQGTLLARNSTIVVTGDVVMLTAGTIVNLGASAWTINGLWTNLSTSASWVAGTSTVTIRDAASGTLTFAALAGGTNEFNNLTLDATVTTSITYTMAANPLRMGATLTIRNSTGGATGPTILTTSASNLGITTGALALTTFGSLTANGSAVVVNGNVNLSAGNGGILAANASTVTASSVAMTGGTSGTITLTTSSFTSTGNWDTSGAGSVFTKGTSTVTMSGVANIAILNASNNFNNLVISAAGTVTQSGLVDVSGTLTVNGGSVLASGTFTLTVATLAANMAGGITAGAAGTKTITGNVSIAAAGYFSFGAATWNFGGSWTNSSTSGSWSVGTGTVVFNSGSSRTMTFANLGVSEFNNVQFSPTAAATFTMVTNGLRWGGTLTLNNNATLSTGNLALTGPGGNLTVNNGATLTAGTSVVSATNVTMTGGTSGAITASGSGSVSGKWDTSGARSVLTAALSTVTLSGTAKTVRILNASNGFGALTISGTVSAASAITLSGPLTVSGTFDTTATNYGLSIGGGLTVSGVAGILRSNGSTVSVAGNVSVNNAGGYITSGAAGSWTVSGSWTNTSTSASWNFAASITFNSSVSQTMTFAVLPGGAAEFTDIAFNSGPSTVTFTMATNRLIWSGTLAVQGGAGATTLATSNLGLTGGAITIDDGGVLTANASAVR